MISPHMVLKTAEPTLDIIDSLCCSFCNKYLSCPPILSDINGKNVCGRCSQVFKPDGHYIRNTIYENLASLVLFPCKNRSSGCPAKLTMKTCKLHESKCKYTTLSCPTQMVDGNCLWIGGYDNIEEHFKANHPELIITLPFCTKPDINLSYQSVYLFKLVEFLFLMQVKCNSHAGRFWHNVLYMGQAEIANLFEFTITIRKGKCCFIKNNPVATYNKLKMIETDGIVHILNFLVTDIGKYEDLDFELSLSMKHERCFNCNHHIKEGPITYIDTKGYLCNECPLANEPAPLVEMPCKFKTKGCKFASVNPFILKKHEIYMCKTGYICPICKIVVKEKLIKHHTEEHCTHLTPEFHGDLAVVSYFTNGEEMNYTMQIHDITFYHEFKMVDDVITMELTTGTDCHGSELFTCRYKITFTGIEKFITGTMCPMTVESMGTYDYMYDWRNYIYLPVTHLRNIQLPDDMTIQISIVKNEESGFDSATLL